jgi:hypothetical protein
MFLGPSHRDKKHDEATKEERSDDPDGNVIIGPEQNTHSETHHERAPHGAHEQPLEEYDTLHNTSPVGYYEAFEAINLSVVL